MTRESLEYLVREAGNRLRWPSVDVRQAVRATISDDEPVSDVDLDHLHLHVRDLDASRRFYERWFGFSADAEPATGETLFARNRHRFLICLTPDDQAVPLPDTVHFGFTLPTSDAVRNGYRRMQLARVTILHELYESEEFVSYAVRDPDGNGIEIYWEG